jgi:hypothetical protein
MKELELVLKLAERDKLEYLLEKIEYLRSRGYNDDYILKVLVKAIQRVISEPGFFGRKRNLPGPGNECGVHTHFTGTVAKLFGEEDG